MLTVLCEVHGSEDLTFHYARVELTEANIARFQMLASKVRELGVYKVEEFDYRMQPMEENEHGDLVEMETDAEGISVRTECDCVNVTSDEVFWSGYVKHTDWRWETQGIPIEKLAGDGTLDLRDR